MIINSKSNLILQNILYVKNKNNNRKYSKFFFIFFYWLYNIFWSKKNFDSIAKYIERKSKLISDQGLDFDRKSKKLLFIVRMFKIILIYKLKINHKEYMKIS